MPGTSRAGGPGACASSPAAAAASPAKSRCDAGCAVPGRQARGMPRRPPHAPDCAASVRTLRGTTFSRGLRSTRWPRTGVPRVPQDDGRRAPMKQGFARVVVKWHLLPRGSWPPSTPWRQRPRRAARNLPKSRRSRPRTTTWRPRIGRWKWLGWPAAGKLPLVHAGGREACGLVGGPGGVVEPYQNPKSCTWITMRLLRARRWR